MKFCYQDSDRPRDKRRLLACTGLRGPRLGPRLGIETHR